MADAIAQGKTAGIFKGKPRNGGRSACGLRPIGKTHIARRSSNDG